MTWLALIPCLLLAAVPPLTEPQQQMLMLTPAKTVNFDQAGLYALLANANTWSNDSAANEAGARLPDYAAINADPAKWRGETCLIEGTLVSRVSLGVLSRVGYENVQTWTIRTPATTSGGGGGGIVIVALTQPPVIQWGQAKGWNTAPLTRDLKIRLVARFYTIYSSPDRDGNKVLDYPLFVGRSAQFPDTRAPGDVAFRPLLLVTLIFVMSAAYVIVIVIRIKRSRENNRKEAEEKAVRRKQVTEEHATDRRDDLPEDPAAAMNALEQEHNQQD